MKNAISKMLYFMLSIPLFVSTGFADNPVVQTNYTADPAPMVYNDRVYLYTSHDEDVTEGFFTMRNWRCYSSTDMVNWTDHGMPASLASFKWAGTNGAWAVQCVYRDGKFYMYCPLQTLGIGVLVSDSPFGPFTDPLDKPLIHLPGDIDPTVFIDDDGQAYLYWGNPNLYYVKLNKDMITYSDSVVTVPLTVASFGVRTPTDKDRTTSYEEGPWFYKRNSLYYMVFAAGPISEHIGYSTSPGPTGPWTYGGVVMPTQGGSFTNHPGVCDYKGNSYFFYHDAGLPGGEGFRRSVCIEQFKYGTDGSIPSMDMTKNGPAQVGTLNPYDTIQAETICWESGVETENCSEGGMDVGFINEGDYIKVKGVDFGTGAISFDARVASLASAGNIELHLDSQTGTLVGTCAVSSTGGWQTWTTSSCMVSGATGIHDLYLKFTGGSNYLFNFNWWKFNLPPVNAIVPFLGKEIKSTKISVEKRVIQVDFSHQVLPHILNVNLFNLNGRQVATLFSGLPSTHLTIPINRADIRKGTYLIKLSSDNEVVLTKLIKID